MELFQDHILLSRLQFAVTAMFHILWPVLTIGLSLYLVVVEILWLRTRDAAWFHQARFWSKLFLLNFGIGVVSGIPLEFEFGTNWAVFSAAAGDFFGNILGFEAAMAFMLEAGFLGIMMFGWKRVAPGIHLFATCMVAFGASLSAFWIMIANAWMQTPAGVRMEDGRVVVESYAEAVFNPAWFSSVSHMWLASLVTSVFVVGGISAWYVLTGRHGDFFLRSFKLAAALALVVTPLQVLTGDMSGQVVAEHQPAKLAAMESHWQTNPEGEPADWAALAWPDPEAEANAWSVEIPAFLSLLTTHSLTGEVTGLEEFPPADRPPVLITFYAFRVMVLIGFFLLAVALWTGVRWWREGLDAGALARRRGLLRAWVASIPLGYVAVEMGWVTREVGRQPWIVHGLMRTGDGASNLPAGTVATSLIAYSAIYLLLLVVFLVFARRILHKGPDLEEAPPDPGAAPPLRVEGRRESDEGRRL